MKVGLESVSDAQKFYLQRALTSANQSELAEIVMQVFRDDDIRSGRETLHPEWIRLYETRKNFLRSVLRRQDRAEIETTLASITLPEKFLANIDPKKVQISFLLGAGASRPKPSNIPTVKELLPQLLDRARRLDRDDVSRLSDFCERRKIDNIEDLLTAAQIATFCSRNPTVLRLVDYLIYRRGEEDTEENYIRRESGGELVRGGYRRRSPADLSSVAFLQDTLHVLFGLLASTMLPAKANEAHKAIAKYCKTSVNAAIITTNYDCCMDAALRDLNQPFTYEIGFHNNSTVGSMSSDNKTKLIKLHGSLNWYYCETCQQIQLVDLDAMLDQYAKDKSPYPVIGICKECGGQRRGLLVPPLAMKFDMAPPLTPLLSVAGQMFTKSDLIVVVGFSFAEADVYISRMLSKSMQRNPSQRLVIADPDPGIATRVQHKLKSSIRGFSTDRVIPLTEDCAKSLPRFLAGDFAKKRQNRRGRPASEKLKGIKA